MDAKQNKNKIRGKTLVLGGGLAGLSAAWRLVENDFSIVLIEKDPVLGGLSANIKKNGFVFNYGPHRFHTCDGDLLLRIKELIGPRLKKVRRVSRIFLGKRYFDYPFNIFNLLCNLDYSTALAIIKDFFIVTAKNCIQRRNEDTFDLWVRRRFGTTLRDIFFKPYTYKLLGIGLENLSSAWGEQRIPRFNLTNIIIRLIYPKANNKPRTYIDTFYYPTNGIGEICNAIERRILDGRGEIFLDSELKEVLVADGKIQSVIFNKNGLTRKLDCDYLVSTIPITDFVKTLRPAAPGQVLELVDSIKYRAIIFVHLIVSKRTISENNWIYFPLSDIVFTRISEPRNFSEEMVRDNLGSLTVEVCCNFKDKTWEMPQNLLFKRIVESLEKSSILKEQDIVDYFISRTPNAYPVYDLKYKDRICELLNYLGIIDNLFLAGRQGLFCYCNMDYAMHTGFSAAENILKKNEDI